MAKNEAKNLKVADQTVGKRKGSYDPKSIEPKWQAKWEKEGIYQPDLDSANGSASHSNAGSAVGGQDKGAAKEGKLASKKQRHQKPVFFNLMMFPYPSAEGLHIGGVRTFGGVDIFGRFQRMRGKEVFTPFGLDGFGIHAENYALKIGAHPMDHSKVTEANYYRQVREAAIGVDWTRTVETYKPEYYKWTQWLFTELYKAGLAYRKKSPVNFCPGCKTVLADEQVIDGKCERCSSVVEKRDLEQWFFRITKYADRLLGNIESLNWTDKVRIAQRNWIGKKEGAEIIWEVTDKAGSNRNIQIVTFTTRKDTLPGVTFLVLAPESLYVKQVTTKEHAKEVKKYVDEAANLSEIEKQSREKTGVFTGSYAKNPFNGDIVPIYVADYVLGGYGTGAVMGMPGHDERDREFAAVFDLPSILTTTLPKGFDELEVYSGAGKQINTGKGYDGLSNKDAGQKIFAELVSQGYARTSIQYHLRDWLISRQRYWGPPIPMVYCEKCAQKKPKILLIHGFSGSSKENWFPWFKKTMEKKGFEVLVPDLPHPENPDLDEWLKALGKLGISKDDKLYIVGHSMGGPAACQFLIRNGLEANKLILIAPTGKEQGPANWAAFSTQVGVEACRKFNAANTDLAKLKLLAKDRVVYLSDNDPYIPMSVEKTYKEIAPEFVKFKNRGHFNAGAGLTEFPEILTEFPEVDELNLGWHPVPQDQLPVTLPHIKDFKPLGTGKAPLANHPEFYETTCPACGSNARRETDVSDTFLDSAWYFFRYISTEFTDRPFDKTRAKHWLPVTMYIGGAEHSVLHLLYARFTTMVLHDLGYIDFEEPFARFYAHGLVIKDGAKMSKSKGNVITPDEYIGKYGADTVRTYLHFLGPFNQDGDFRDSGIEGMHRFLVRVWKLLTEARSKPSTSAQAHGNQESRISNEARSFMHETIKGVTEDMEGLRFNTVIAKLMTWYNFLVKQPSVSLEEAEVYLKLLAPFAPHLTEELWQELRGDRGDKGDTGAETKGWESIHTQDWPTYNEAFILKDVAVIAIQINGKLRSTLEVSLDVAKDQKAIEARAKADEKVQNFLKSGTIRKVIYIPGKILNFVVA